MTKENLHKLNCIDSYLYLEKALNNQQPFSLIRLGDGEGALMGFPDITDIEAVKRSFSVWFGHTDIDLQSTSYIGQQIRDSVFNADIVGLPRDAQLSRHPYYRAVFDAMSHYRLYSESALYTDAAIHRYFQFCLLFRKLLSGRDYVGIITPRDLRAAMKTHFNVGVIEHYPIKGEARFSGSVEMPHYPDAFNKLIDSLSPPYKGALYLVGAGGLGKIYCNVIKQRGGVAVDVGAIFDAWAGVKSRLIHPSHSIERYAEFPSISSNRAFSEFNLLCEHFNIDTERLNVDDYPSLGGTIW